MTSVHSVPLAPIITPPSPTTTNDPRPVISGVADPSTVINVFANAPFSYLGTTLDVPNWALNYAYYTHPLAAGTYTITATSTDGTGTSPVSNGITLTITDVPIIISPVDGAVVCGQPTLTGTTPSGTTVVQVFDDGTPLGNAIVTGTSWTFTPSVSLPHVYSFAAQATTPNTVTNYPLPIANSGPVGITAGPDGNLWFTERTGNRIGKITPAGTITETTIATVNSLPVGITAGPDGNLWFTEQVGNKIGKITTAGVILNEFPIPTLNSSPSTIVTGPDGNLWFTEQVGNKIGKITPAGIVTEFSVGITPGGSPFGIAAGSDGNLWFTEIIGNKIGKMTTAGVVLNEFPIPTINSRPQGITAGPDGNLWFAEGTGNKIGRITPAGTITEFPIPTLNSSPIGITAGPDGNLWFAEVNKIGRITPAGVITEYATGITGDPINITAGPDGNLWFTDFLANRIVKIGTDATSALSAAVVVTANPNPAAPVAPNQTACEGTTLFLTASSIPGVSYAWTGPNGFTSNEQNPSIPNVSLAAAGSYIVTVTDGNGCTNQATAQVAVNPNPAAPVAPNQTVCEGTTLFLTASVIPGVSYSWTGPNGFTSDQQNPSIPNVTLAAAGVYTVTVTDGNGCTNQATAQVTVNLNPIATLGASAASVCDGVQVTLTAFIPTVLTNAVGADTYSAQLFDNGIPTGDFVSGSGSIIVFMVTPTVGSHSYTVHIVNEVTGCEGDSNPTIVVVTALPAAPVAPNQTACEGTTLFLTASSIPGVSYSWTGPNGFTSNEQNPSIPNVSLLAAGPYTVTVTDGNECTNQATAQVTVNPKPAAPVAPDQAVCEGATLFLTASSIPGVSYSWTGPNGFVSDQQNPSIPNVSLLAAGPYIATVTDGNGCTNQATAQVAVNSNPATPVAPDKTVCEGATLFLTASSTTLGVSYSWTGPHGFTSNEQNPSIPNVSLSAAGIYIVTVTLNGCTAQADAQVTVNPKPTIEVSANPTVITQGQSATLTATVGSGTPPYSVTFSDGFISPVSTDTGVNHEVNPTTTTTYAATVTDFLGCISDPPATITLTVNTPTPPPIPSKLKVILCGPKCRVSKTCKPRISGRATPGATVYLTANNRLVGKATASNNGCFCVKLRKALCKGCNTIVATAKNGNEIARSNALKVLVG